MDVVADFSGGCADSGITAAAGCPTLCSVGPIGGAGHTPEEFILLDSVCPQHKRWPSPCSKPPKHLSNLR